jgi:chemotaxis protein MotB
MTQPWQRRPEQASRIDDWLMTYADMITLLLCFFAIFLSTSVRPDKAEPNLRIPASPEPATHLEFKTGADRLSEVLPSARTDRSYASLLGIINRLKSQGPSSIEQVGDRITTLQMSSAAFFNSGSAILNDSGRAILKEVAVNIESDKYSGYQVTVEGHTDDRPIRTRQFPSNWELSTARAAAVVHFFLQQGIPAERLRAAGYADTFPIVPNRSAQGKAIPANQARNRRVVIKLEKIEKIHPEMDPKVGDQMPTSQPLFAKP